MRETETEAAIAATGQDSTTGSGKCRRRIVTIPLFLLNLITWICGGALIGLGIWVINTDKDYKYFAEIQNIYIVYMTLSAVLFTAGIFGACGILASNRMLLKLYIMLICLVFGGLLGLVIFTALQRSFVEKYIVKQWNESSDDTRKYLQKEFSCCGIDKKINVTHDKSCFVNSTKFDGKKKESCLEKLRVWFEDNQTILAGVGSSIIVVMIILMLSTCWLIQNIKHRTRRNQVVPLQSKRIRVEDNNCEMVEVEQPETSGKKWAKHSLKY